jgi:hypothetical protein
MKDEAAGESALLFSHACGWKVEKFSLDLARKISALFSLSLFSNHMDRSKIAGDCSSRGLLIYT